MRPAYWNIDYFCVIKSRIKYGKIQKDIAKTQWREPDG